MRKKKSLLPQETSNLFCSVFPQDSHARSPVLSLSLPLSVHRTPSSFKPVILCLSLNSLVIETSPDTEKYHFQCSISDRSVGLYPLVFQIYFEFPTILAASIQFSVWFSKKSTCLFMRPSIELNVRMKARNLVSHCTDIGFIFCRFQGFHRIASKMFLTR